MVSYLATDVSGNSNSCSFELTVGFEFALHEGWNLVGVIEPIPNLYKDFINGSIWYWQVDSYHETAERPS